MGPPCDGVVVRGIGLRRNGGTVLGAELQGSVGDRWVDVVQHVQVQEEVGRNCSVLSYSTCTLSCRRALFVTI